MHVSAAVGLRGPKEAPGGSRIRARACELKKVGEWLRDAALAEARGEDERDTDPILLAELMGIRALILNLFREGSRNPISDVALRKISAYSDSVKQQKADEFLAKLRVKSGAAKPPENEP